MDEYLRKFDAYNRDWWKRIEYAVVAVIVLSILNYCGFAYGNYLIGRDEYLCQMDTNNMTRVRKDYMFYSRLFVCSHDRIYCFDCGIAHRLSRWTEACATKLENMCPDRKFYRCSYDISANLFFIQREITTEEYMYSQLSIIIFSVVGAFIIVTPIEPFVTIYSNTIDSLGG